MHTYSRFAYVSPGVYPNCLVRNLDLSWHLVCENLQRRLKGTRTSNPQKVKSYESVQLEVPIENNRLFIYDRPHLYPLARVLDQYRHYAVVLAESAVRRGKQIAQAC
jgi:hypothetical protein